MSGEDEQMLALTHWSNSKMQDSLALWSTGATAKQQISVSCGIGSRTPGSSGRSSSFAAGYVLALCYALEQVARGIRFALSSAIMNSNGFCSMSIGTKSNPDLRSPICGDEAVSVCGPPRTTAVQSGIWHLETGSQLEVLNVSPSVSRLPILPSEPSPIRFKGWHCQIIWTRAWLRRRSTANTHPAHSTSGTQ
jgi:hypothetical protein